MSYVDYLSNDFVMIDTRCMRIYDAKQARLVVNASTFSFDDSIYEDKTEISVNFTLEMKTAFQFG